MKTKKTERETKIGGDLSWFDKLKLSFHAENLPKKILAKIFGGIVILVFALFNVNEFFELNTKIITSSESNINPYFSISCFVLCFIILLVISVGTIFSN